MTEPLHQAGQLAALPADPPAYDLTGRATRDPNVIIAWSAPAATGTITRITVAGRPTHLFAGEGNHVTAWAVFVDTVRRALVGRTLAQAVTALETLTAAPHGYGQDDQTDQAPVRHADAVQRATAHLGAAAAQGGTPRSSLRRAVGAYLSARNYAPLALAWLGPAQATGGGEQAALNTLRRNEVDDGTLAATVRTAVWTLLDARTIGFALGTTSNTTSLPGLDVDDRRTTARTMVRRHLAEIRAAYPVSYAKAAFTDALIDTHTTGFGFQNIAALTWPAGTDFAAAPHHPARAAAGWADQALSGATVTVTPDLDGQVETVTVAGRGNTLLNGQGEHMTAHIVLVRQLRRALEGKTFDEARTDLLTLGDRMRELPTFPPLVDDEPVVRAAGDARGIFTDAWAEDEAARADLRAAAGDDRLVAALGSAASRYLSLRNALPLVAVDIGTVAGAKAEAAILAELDDSEAHDRGAAADIAANLWLLLCLQGLRRVYSDDDLTRIAPGAPIPSPTTRLVQVIQVHRQAIRGAWPVAYGRSHWNTTGSLRTALTRLNLPVGQDEFQELTDRLVLGDEPRFKPRFPVTASDDEAADPVPRSVRDYVPPSRAKSSRKAALEVGDKAKRQRQDNDEADAREREEDEELDDRTRGSDDEV
ncbi:hypothetical protein [Dactylosporangium sp. NPDC005555]|uniref:hypothetical protein n=1 Tax=Dactylosporangium sp. NPDC005555 TaxID=3154889 RepID=UPI0033B7898C